VPCLGGAEIIVCDEVARNSQHEPDRVPAPVEVDSRSAGREARIRKKSPFSEEQSASLRQSQRGRMADQTGGAKITGQTGEGEVSGWSLKVRRQPQHVS
jgi:hypothetical protein